MAGVDRDWEQGVVEAAQRALAGGEPAEIEAALRALQPVFVSHQDRVYGLCLRVTGDPERAREASQEALLAAWTLLPTFRGDSRFGTWLYGIARNKAYKAIRKRGELLTEDGVIEAADPVATVLTELRHHEREELLRQAMAEVLTPEEQEAAYLRYTEQLPVDRITVVMRLGNASGARGLLQRVRRKLENELRRRLAALGHGSSFVRRTW